MTIVGMVLSALGFMIGWRVLGSVETGLYFAAFLWVTKAYVSRLIDTIAKLYHPLNNKADDPI